MIKIKVKDLQLAIDYIGKNVVSEYIELDVNESSGAAASLTFVDKLSKPCKIFLYQSDKNVTPEVRVTTRLYKTE